MTLKQAFEILGRNRSVFELKHIVKALSSLELLNTPEENKRLEAAKTILKSIKRK